ncbi:hypothetical protein [Palleronia marisminoris]|nr:hypothetical protein [Palleronia marisminoris]
MAPTTTSLLASQRRYRSEPLSILSDGSAFLLVRAEVAEAAAL